MADTPLRSLAKAYSKKNLEHTAYREARAKYINGVLSGELELPVNTYPPLIRPEDEESMEETVRRDKNKKKNITKEVPDQAATASPSKNKPLLIAIIAIVFIVITIGVYIGNDDSPDADGPSGIQTSAQVDVSAAQSLINDFLDKPSWTETGLNNFLQQWNSLSSDVRIQALQTIEISQLTNAIYKQLLQERALSGIGGSENNNTKQLRLIEFAEQVGIEDKRVSMPD